MNVGDLIQVREEIPHGFGPPVGTIGIVEEIRMDRVCVKAGLVGRAPEDGGPVHDFEKVILATFAGRLFRASHYSDHYDVVAEAS
jgi:hypothetical protein